VYAPKFIDALKAQIKRRPAMKKVSTVAAKQSKNFFEQKLTIGLDLGIGRAGQSCPLHATRRTFIEKMEAGRQSDGSTG
jgi:hypothetical protein